MQARMIIGLTGGIASGKTEVTRRFAARGAAIVDADVIARDVVAAGTVGLAAVVERFGVGVLAPDGSLDRTALRRHVFDAPAARADLESIVHPLVRAQIATRCLDEPGPYVIVAIPLLAEGRGRSAYPMLDRFLLVDVPVDVQRRRLIERDGIDAVLADRMIAAQATRLQRLAIADDVIVNTSDRDSLDVHVVALDRRYRK